MFIRFSRVVSATIAFMCVIGAAQASASTWTVSGSPAFTATTGPLSISTAGGTLSCTGATSTGMFSATTSTSVPWTGAATGSVTFSGCRMGVLNVQTSGTYGYDLASFTSGVTTGWWRFHWFVSLAGRVLCWIDRNLGSSASFQYRNATVTFDHPANSAATVSNGTGATCPLGNGVTGSLTQWTARVTSSPAPQVTLS